MAAKQWETSDAENVENASVRGDKPRWMMSWPFGNLCDCNFNQLRNRPARAHTRATRKMNGCFILLEKNLGSTTSFINGLIAARAHSHKCQLYVFGQSAVKNVPKTDNGAAEKQLFYLFSRRTQLARWKQKTKTFCVWMLLTENVKAWFRG